MKQLFTEIQRLLREGEAVVLITVIADSGSTPRGAGARMIVREDGTTMGTIGGGAVEYKAGQMGHEILKDKASLIKGFRLAKNEVADLGMICGGDVAAYFQYIDPDNEAFVSICAQVLEALDRDEDSWIVTDITDETAWAMGIYSESTGMSGLAVEDWEPLTAAKAVQVSIGTGRYYSEPLVRSGKVYVFGGGHVAQELVPVLSHVGFRCVVYDDRIEFANLEMFPQADETIVGKFEHAMERLSIREQDYIAIMTRGHQSDFLIQRQALRTPAHYIGVMGSRHKLHALAGKLREEGFTDEEINRCYSPIGTEISAETPAEIAVSVAGQLIQVRAGREGRGKQ